MSKTVLRMSEEMDSLLGALASRQGVAKTQALQRAIALLKYLEDAEEEGSTVVVRSADGTEKEIVFDADR